MIELDLEQLPEGEEVLTILRQEQAPMNNWVTLAVRAKLLQLHKLFSNNIFTKIARNIDCDYCLFNVMNRNCDS